LHARRYSEKLTPKERELIEEIKREELVEERNKREGKDAILVC
jgi:hypothetical protein